MIHRSDLKWLLGATAAVCTGLVGFSEVLSRAGWLTPTTNARLMIIGFICGILASYRITPSDSEKRS